MEEKKLNELRLKKIIQRIAGILLLLFPIVLMVAFALHYESIADFFVFELKYEASSAGELMNTLRSEGAFRYYILPHLIAYLGVPLYFSTALTLGYVIYKKRPGFAIIGIVLTGIGSIYMGSLFGTWLSFGAIGNVPVNQIGGATYALEALTEMQGIMMLTTLLASLVLIGLIILAIGLILSYNIPKWSGILLLIGNILILIFMDLDNWMFIGASLILIGLIPISKKLIKNEL